MFMQCWKCQQEQLSYSKGKIPFRATCEKCDYYLHSCKNCQHYRVGQPNDCLIPGTEQVRDRENFNFCEEFCVKSENNGKLAPPREDLKERFNSLFDDNTE